MTFQHNVKVAFLDVGQGDSIVVTVPDTGEAVIIDCPEADTVIEYLRGEPIRFIRGLIITHLHLDHYRESVGFVENCRSQLGIECERLIFNWPSSRHLLAPDADGHSEIYSDPKRRERARRTAYQELVAWAEQNTRLSARLWADMPASQLIEAAPEHIIGDRVDDSDLLPAGRAANRIERMAPHGRMIGKDNG